MRRPRLTKKVAKWLSDGANHLLGDADFIEDDEKREGIRAVCNYMWDLSHWHETKQRGE